MPQRRLEVFGRSAVDVSWHVTIETCTAVKASLSVCLFVFVGGCVFPALPVFLFASLASLLREGSGAELGRGHTSPFPAARACCSAAAKESAALPLLLVLLERRYG